MFVSSKFYIDNAVCDLFNKEIEKKTLNHYRDQFLYKNTFGRTFIQSVTIAIINQNVQIHIKIKYFINVCIVENNRAKLTFNIEKEKKKKKHKQNRWIEWSTEHSVLLHLKQNIKQYLMYAAAHSEKKI